MKELIVIGAGPAGLTAALYASRAGVDTMIIEKGAPGGKVFVTHKVENYPGFESITGRELAQNMHKHALKFGAEYQYGEVLSVEDHGEYKLVKTNIDEYQAKNVILATGTENRKLNVKGEEEFAGKGVSYCAICDGNFFKDLEVAVIGGGNSALEEALYLADLCKKVTIVHRRNIFRAENYIVEKVKARDNIVFELDSVTD
ncbi:MAG: NAD(P)/FAD-dependent oxidoreductase, partial [Bacilli bacterium]